MLCKYGQCYVEHMGISIEVLIKDRFDSFWKEIRIEQRGVFTVEDFLIEKRNLRLYIF